MAGLMKAGLSKVLIKFESSSFEIEISRMTIRNFSL